MHYQFGYYFRICTANDKPSTCKDISHPARIQLTFNVELLSIEDKSVLYRLFPGFAKSDIDRHFAKFLNLLGNNFI